MSSPVRLRLASYNIHKCVGPDGQRAPGRILDVLNSIDADIVALQEVDHRLGKRPAALSPSLIATHSDYVPLAAAVKAASLGWHGNAILLRRGMAGRVTARLGLPGLEPRGAVLAAVETRAGTLRIAGAHLGLIRRHRTGQLAAIHDELVAAGEGPAAILGDFNEWSLTRGLEMLSPAYRVVAPGRSFQILRPIAHLDRIALSAGLHLRDAGVTDTPLARRASDHLPIWVDVALPGGGRRH